MLAKWRLSLQVSCAWSHCRYYAATTPSSLLSPPLLLKLRLDLKTAMKERDTSRLNVLRNLLTEITNSAKTSSPIKTDMQLLSLLRKRTSAAKNASSEFRTAGRQDLAEVEDKQARIMEDYAGAVETMRSDDLKAAVGKVVDEVKATAGGKVNAGEVIRRLLAPGGDLDGKPVEKAEVAKFVKETLAQP